MPILRSGERCSLRAPTDWTSVRDRLKTMTLLRGGRGTGWSWIIELR